MSLEDRFRTPDGAARFLAAYDATLALWPVPHDSVDVSTRFGMTHINIAGAPDLPPLVLLHGAQISSPVWYATVEPLSRHFRVYAPDAVDQMGRSVPSKQLKTAKDCADWLIEVLDALKLKDVVLIGHSQGSWQALNLGLTAPERVKKLGLLSPSGSFSRVHWQMLLRMLPVFIRPTKKTFYSCFQWLTTLPLGTAHPLADQFMIGAQSFKPSELSLGVVAVYKDEQLRQIKSPTLLLVGDHDGTCRLQADVERARHLISQIETEIIAGGGHLLPIDRAEAVNARLLKFLLGATSL
jgi:pimeloyl-ACP methyl ester carboxylesterase